jgi:xanthosine utilization system XapX-like protein
MRTAAFFASFALAASAHAYPGGTPEFQTDAAPYCASCHSSANADMMRGAAPDRAQKELAANKHVALITAGEGGYQALSAAERALLAEHVRAVDANTSVKIEAPPKVAINGELRVSVHVTGGAGPVVGVALVDTPQRWLARPATAVGWFVSQEPQILGQDFQQQTDWLAKRPLSLMRNLAYVNVTGLRSDAVKSDWARTQVVWTLRAPSRPGKLPLAAALWYGTEKASPLGVVTDPIRGRMLRGGVSGHSGRILFSTPLSIEVTVK